MSAIDVVGLFLLFFLGGGLLGYAAWDRRGLREVRHRADPGDGTFSDPTVPEEVPRRQAAGRTGILP